MSALNSLLPIALAIIMLGLGLSLTAADFRRVQQSPALATQSHDELRLVSISA